MKKNIAAIAAELFAALEKVHSVAQEEAIVAAFLEALKKTHATAQGPAIVAKLEQLYEKKHGVVRGMVTTATVLHEDQKKELVATVRKQYGSEHVHLEYVVRPDVLGGMALKIDDMLYDSTLKRKLHTLSTTLTQ